MTYREPHYNEPERETMYIEGFWWKSILTVGSMSLIGVVVFASVMGIRSCNAPQPCTESSVLIHGDGLRECAGGGRLSSTIVGDNAIEVRCLCDRVNDVDAGGAR